MKNTNQARKSKPSRKWLAIKTGAGMVTGYIEGFWTTSIGRYVTIPGASRHLDPDDMANVDIVAALEFAAVAQK
ncbi:MAG: hypothetical protein AAB654_17295 [Acidobacteriota bacterium]